MDYDSGGGWANKSPAVKYSFDTSDTDSDKSPSEMSPCVRRPTRRTLGLMLIAVGIASVVGSLAVSAVLATDITRTTAPPATEATEQPPANPAPTEATAGTASDERETRASAIVLPARSEPGDPLSQRGRTLVGIQGVGEVAILDATGESVWEASNATGYYDATLLPNGNVLTTPPARRPAVVWSLRTVLRQNGNPNH